MRWFVFTVLVVLLAALPARAQDNGSVVLVNKGVPGFWFPEATATKMLQDLEELPLLRQKVDALELKISRMEDLILLMKDERSVTEQISAKWKLAFDEQLKITTEQRDHYEELLAQEKKWYRSPVLWFSVGVIATAALAIGLNYGLAETK
jgi:hypothetical protein